MNKDQYWIWTGVSTEYEQGLELNVNKKLYWTRKREKWESIELKLGPVLIININKGH